jgi:hypothetical protein
MRLCQCCHIMITMWEECRTDATRIDGSGQDRRVDGRCVSKKISSPRLVVPFRGWEEKKQGRGGLPTTFASIRTTIAPTSPGCTSVRSIGRGSTAYGAFVRVRVFTTQHHGPPVARVEARETKGRLASEQDCLVSLRQIYGLALRGYGTKQHFHGLKGCGVIESRALDVLTCGTVDGRLHNKHILSLH